jgi:predicted secreted protein
MKPRAHGPVVVLQNLINRLRPTRAAGEIADEVADIRGRRFVAVIDCILNQNVRDCGAARFPAMNLELVQLCHAHRVGIVQMPCPEIAALGFKRKRPPGQSIRDALDTEAGRRRCADLAVEVSDRVEFYLTEGYKLLAILGGNPRSPGCAVHAGNHGLRCNSGVFMQALETELRKRNHTPAFRGIRDHDPELLRQDLQWLRDLLESA